MTKSFAKHVALFMSLLAIFSVFAFFVACGKTVTNGETYSVVFDEDGGSAVAAQRVPSGGKAVKPADPIKSGCTFGGWYKDSDCTLAWNFETDTVTGNIVLHAKWNIGGTGGTGGNTGGSGGTGGGQGDIIGTGDNVTVTFNVGYDARKAGASNPPALTIKSGGTITPPTVNLSGYTVDGWYAEDGSGKWNFGSDKVMKNTTLFARWKSTGGGGGAAPDYVPTQRDDDTLYIHYYRSAGDYDNWYIYNWGNGYNREITEYETDASGAVYALDLMSAPCYGLSSVNFIVTQPGWNKDGGDNVVVLDRALKAGGSYHWFVSEGKTAFGSDKFEPSIAFDTSYVTEEKRESRGDVDRATAAALPVAPTATTCDEMGVGYQIFVASFCDSDGDGVGDIRGIINKLDYLQSLNADVLWLTPVQSSNSYHGYDCYDYYCIDPKFGTNADYRELVYKAHGRGIKVIMDLVVNHTSPNNEWFIKSKQGVVETVTYQDGTTAQVKYRDFYRWSRQSGIRRYSAGDGWYFYSSFGSNMPELNYDCQAVRRAMTDVAAYWMSYGLDGFRMDAIKHIFMNDESENASGDRIVGDSGWQYNLDKNTEFFKEFNYTLKSKYPHCFLLGEQLDGNADNVAPFYAGMDSLFDFYMYYNLPGRIQNGNVTATAGEFNSNAQKYASYRGGTAINSMISSNHDIPRLSSLLSSEAQIKLYFAVMMTMPGLSWIYYGDEIALAGSGKSDKNFRQSMKWTYDWQYKCQNEISDINLNTGTVSVAEQSADSGSLLSYVRALTKLRNDNPVLINGAATCAADNGMLKITVTNGTRQLTAYHNFTSTVKTVSGTPVFGSNTVPAYGTVVVK